MDHKCNGQMDGQKDILVTNAMLHYIVQPETVSDGFQVTFEHVSDSKYRIPQRL